MERKKSWIIVVLFLSMIVSYASAKLDIYNSYVKNEMFLWKKTIDEMNKYPNKNFIFILDLVNYQYGYIAWCIANEKDDEAEQYLELAEKHLELLENNQVFLSFVNAYKSAFYGFKIGLNLYKAPFIGPKSISVAKIAIQQDPKNPYGYIQYGNTQYYMPETFGGSKAKAIQYYKKAQQLMEQQGKSSIQNDWNYLSLLTTIGTAYEAIGNYKEARIYYEKILYIEPQFLWVKNELYPQLLKKIKL